MDIFLSDGQMETIAKKTAGFLLKKLREGGEQPSEMVSVKEAAHILGITPNHMRRIKDKFPHIKNGQNSQGRLLFKRDSLLPEYAK